MIQVKNVGRSPQTVEGSGVLAAGETGQAEDTEHTRALIDAGHLLELDEPAPARSRTRAADRGE